MAKLTFHLYARTFEKERGGGTEWDGLDGIKKNKSAEDKKWARWGGQKGKRVSRRCDSHTRVKKARSWLGKILTLYVLFNEGHQLVTPEPEKWAFRGLKAIPPLG